MKRYNGFTLIELLIVIAMIGIVVSIAMAAIVNNRGATEMRATETLETFLRNNDIVADRMSCAGDSDGDGYGSCTVVVADTKEKIYLDCPSDWMAVNIWGATNCREVETRWRLSGSRK